MGIVVLVLWVVGLTYIVRDIEHCGPEPDGKIPQKIDGKVVCK
jgi:hypothetical protein